MLKKRKTLSQGSPWFLSKIKSSVNNELKINLKNLQSLFTL